MEALTAVSVAALTIYDMCKAVQKDICITDVRLNEKTGGNPITAIFEATCNNAGRISTNYFTVRAPNFRVK
jgi:hypothetical protein